MSSSAEATVVIPCLNSVRSLERVLRALDEQSIRSTLRVLVVDNSSADGSAQIAERLADVCLSVTGSHGPSHPRNAGLAIVDTPFMLTLDADCVPVDAAWAQRHLEALSQAAASVVGTASTILPYPTDDWWSRRSDMTPHARVVDDVPLYASGGNSCYRTDLVRRLGGFPPFAADDAALGAVARSAGFEFAWVADAPVYHLNPRGWRGYYRQMHKIGGYAAELEEAPPVPHFLAGQLRHFASSAKPLIRGDVREALALATRATAQTFGALSVWREADRDLARPSAR